MAVMKNLCSLLLLFLAVCVVKLTHVAQLACSLDDPSYRYCHTVKAKADSGSENRTEKVFSIYQCRDHCDRQSCEAFEYRVNIASKLSDCKHFFGSRMLFTLMGDADCNKTQWKYGWLRKGNGRLWKPGCNALTALKEVHICENDEKQISCTDGMSLEIESATYGRLNDQTCQRNERLLNTRCIAATSLSKVKEHCEGKQRCTLVARNSVFGDPCLGTYKYLHIEYRCN